MLDSLSRRAFLSTPLALAETSRVRREIFLPSNTPGAAVMAYAFYTQRRGGRMVSIEQKWSRSDTVDIAYIRRSSDFGRTWSQPAEMRTGERKPEGMLRRHPRAGWLDASSERYVEFWTEGVLPSDDPLEGLRNWNIFYRVSLDGGVTFGPPQQVIHTGDEYSSRHPLPGVWTGKNCAMLGDMTCVPVNSKNGILLPIQITPLGPDGKLYNPAGGYTYTDAAVLLGVWRSGRIQWTMSDLIKGDPARSTRGLVEPTLEFLNDGGVLCILRGSNDRNPDLPSYKWMCVSRDSGRTWSKPEPWTYDDGSAFFSPSSCSQLIRHSSGRLFWVGNITPENPRGNRPRFPMVIGEVHRGTGRLQKSSVQVIDTLAAGEDPILSLSNFYARENRESKEIAVHMTRLFARPQSWSGDAYLYSITV